MRRLVILAAAVAVTAAGFAGGAVLAGPAAEGPVVRVDRVVDGDTFQVGNRRVRVTRLNTPEIRGRCNQERRMAIEAREIAASLLAGGVVLRRDPTARQDRDFFGRELRDAVLPDGRRLSDVLKTTESRERPGFMLGYEYTRGASKHFDWCGSPPVRAPG